LFKQILQKSYRCFYVAITQNAGASGSQMLLPADAALGYLTVVMNAADSRLPLRWYQQIKSYKINQLIAAGRNTKN
jgi:hypothetical protein